jgi:hypothetical protein
MIVQTAVIKALFDALEKDRDRWKNALIRCTDQPDDDPESMAGHVIANFARLYTERQIIARENAKLREVLERSIMALRMFRDCAEGPEMKMLARDVVNQLEALHVGRGKQTAAEPGPSEALFDIARKESA